MVDEVCWDEEPSKNGGAILLLQLIDAWMIRKWDFAVTDATD